MQAAERRASACEECGAGAHAGQRYCLACGGRIGPPSPYLHALLGRLRAGLTHGPADHADARRAKGESSDVREAAPRTSLLAGLSELSLPSPRVSALLVLAFVGFGVLLGSAAGSRVDDTLAASARPGVKLLLPASSTPAAPGVSEGAGGGEAATPGGESPSVTEQPTPAPAAEAVAPTHTVAPAKGGATPKATEKGASPPAATSAKLPAIEHVFVVMLSDEPYAATFGPESAAPYLSRTLERRGLLLARFYAVAHEQLADGIALLSGQGPTPATAANCQVYAPVAPVTTGALEQVAGDGCVYPATTATLPGQLEVKRRTWRAYVQGLGEAPGAAPACAHPTIGQPDASASGSAGQPYATFRNPFVYFQGLVESPSCAANDVGLNRLDADLASAARTPSFSYIVPDRCHDASPGPCPGGGPGGLPAADALLAQVVPKILASAAYKHDGLLLITTDEAPSSGELADSSSCCGQPRFPNLPPPSGAASALPPEGGGQVGALLLSPFVKGAKLSQEPYDDYSLLRTIEDLFALKRLGYAGAPDVSSFAPSLFQKRPSG